MTHTRLPRTLLPLGLALPLLLLGGLAAPALRRARADGEPALRRNAVVRAVERSRPAVVSIHTTQLIQQRLYGWELPPVEGTGIGSGAIFHPAGYVVTNAHVVARASKVLIDIDRGDGKTVTHDGRICAIDLPHDLAILRLMPAKGEPADVRYPYLPLGHSDDLMVGETVIAIGNPFGIGITATSGIIGALHRKLHAPPPPKSTRASPAPDSENEDRVLDDFIQIDAAINPGNSGGPLFDITGRWIGVNTAIWNRQLTTAEGIGFSVPVDQVRSLYRRSFKRRLIRGDWLGLEFEEGPRHEALVRFVYPKGPAHDLGIRKDDRVTSLDGEATPTLFALRWQLAFPADGAVVHLGLERDGRALPQAFSVPLLPVPTVQLSDRHLGLVAVDLSTEDSRTLDLPLDSGVVVRQVRPGGPADAIGMRPGDVIVALGTFQIRHTDDLLLFLQYVQAGDLVKVTVKRSMLYRGGNILRVEKEGTMRAR